MAQGFLKGTASLTTGSNIMTLDGGVDASFVTSGSHIEIDGFMTVEGMSGTIGQITLRDNWTELDQTGIKFIVTYTIEGLVDAVEKSRLISEEWKQSVNDVDEIIETAGTAVEDLIALEEDIATAQTDLSTIQGSLDADKAASALSETNAGLHATAAQLAEANTLAIYDNFDDRSLGAKASDPTVDNDGDPLQVGANYWNTTTDSQRFYNGVTWEDPSASTTQSAIAAALSATNAENSNLAAANEVTLAQDEVVLAKAEVVLAKDEVVLAQAESTKSQQWAEYPEDSPIPDTGGLGFSSLHYSAKAEALAGGTAPDSLKLGSELPSFYATKIEVDAAQATADAAQSTANKAKIFAFAGIGM